MGELFVAGITTLDILVIYVFLKVQGRKVVLACWTALLNMLLPFLGFLLGEFSTALFADWSILLSSLLLGLIGLHMLLEDANEQAKFLMIHPSLIAFIVSIDAFTVSVTFGMLQLNKAIFIISSGIFSFIFALIALYFQKKLKITNGKRIRQFAGVSLIVIGVLSFIH